jgi:signal transduction histidine kinase
MRVSGGLDFQEDLYRIMSEALHNVVKHANATALEVSIAREDVDLVVLVRDDGALAGTSSDRPSLGLLSMRERTERWGGRFEAGPCADRGWVVRAAVPILNGEHL